MRRFAQLFTEVDRTTRTTEKVAALVRYFEEAPPADAAWVVALLTGRRMRRPVSSKRLRTWAAEIAALPDWLVSESYSAVGDLSETLALILPAHTARTDIDLHTLIEQRIQPLAGASPDRQREIIIATWAELDPQQTFVFHKLLMGNFRMGVARTLITRALATVAGIEQPDMAHRLAGHWEPTAERFEQLISDEPDERSMRPYPFYLASPHDGLLDELGRADDWAAEWKWDGLRAQVVRRGDETVIWSRGDELMNDAFPEVVDAATALPPETVIDGEILAWEDDTPLPFVELQKRIGRKQREVMLFDDVPVVLMAFDVLELDGDDVRLQPFQTRRARLHELLDHLNERAIVLSPLIDFDQWSTIAAYQQNARSRQVEGVMLKRLDSIYKAGRVRGDWWKRKVDPFTLDVVMIYAQLGSGKRASLFTDYTFGVWDNGELVPIAKAYSGLDDTEIRKVDAFVRRHTLDRHGPLRVVEPKLVFELAFENLQPSDRHKSGIALRFPRMKRWRHDKTPAEADTLQTVQTLLDDVSRGSV